MYTPVNPQFYYIKVGFKWVKIIKACFRDASVSALNSFVLLLLHRYSVLHRFRFI